VPLIVSTYAFQISIAIAFWLLFVNAKREGARWLWTLLWGIVFGYIVETVNVHQTSPPPLYEYPDCLVDGHTVCVTKVAAWVPIGWGEILYMATWTSQRLRIKRWAKPVAAAFLAVNFDLTLDPVAQATGLWCWFPTDNNKVNLFNVPFDNFLAWFFFVTIYASCVRIFLRKATPKDGALRKPWVDFWMAGLATLMALGGFMLVKMLSGHLSVYSHDDGTLAGKIFIGVAVGASLFTWFHALGSRRDRSVNWAPLAIPAYFHALSLVLVVATGVWKDNPAVVIAIPSNLMIGFLLYAWPSLESLVRSPGRTATLD
jgi:uncharacterized membrane protein